MANVCAYTMRVVGKEECVEKLLEILKYKNPEKQMHRVFSADVFSRESREDGSYVVDICGDCAWSVSSSMMPPEAGEGSTYSANLVEQSEHLGLAIEVISKEPGFGFSEYILIEKGCVLEDKACQYFEFFDAEEFEEAKTAHPELRNYSWDDAEDDVLEIGGYDECFSI